MTTKETKNLKTVEVVRERERERLSLNQFGLDKCFQNGQFSRVINYIESNKKDRLKCSRGEGRINLLHDRLFFL